MLDAKQVKAEAEKEVREEEMKTAKEKIKGLLRKQSQARQVLSNIEKELNDAYASIGEGTSLQPSN